MIYIPTLCALLPIAGGIYSYFSKKKGALSKIVLFASSILPLVLLSLVAILGTRGEASLFSLTKDIRLCLRVDTVGLFFGILASAAFLLVSIYGLSYFHEDERKNKFDCFFLLSLGAVLLLCFAGNLLTMYVCFEAVTLFSMPLVLHDKTKESIDASLKYLLYSVGGAFLGFIGIVYLSINSVSDTFALGGVLKAGVEDTTAFGVILLLMLIGFGTKCGLFPLHNWLPTAHPVAPAPASALLSGIITKSGVIALIRIVYFTVGTEKIRGTWVHTTWLILIMTTILLGSFMAVIQKNFKKRLAFSTVSQVSYVLLGLASFTEDSFSGAFLQVASHATIKIGLFLVAGTLLHCLDIHNVDEIEGAGKRMPVTMWCYTICALGLVGVPPTIGFVAKWYLAGGALDANLGAISVIAPVVLIISAILTAYYLLSCTVSAFFPKDKTVKYERVKEPAAMVVPLVILAALTVLLGICGSFIVNIASKI